MEAVKAGKLEIKVSGHGAELHSIVKNGKEFLWQGDPGYWGRHSPVLFPIVGRVWEDEYRYKGKTYRLSQHGFARDMDFSLVSKTEDSIVYELVSNEETLRLYPCPFRLRIGYRVEESSVIVSWKVENTGSEQMDFQIGAHPAFYFPDFDPDSKARCLFSFDNGNPLKYIVPVAKGCTGIEEYELARNAEGYMEAGSDSFECDTYTFENSQLGQVTMCDLNGRPYISVEFDTPLVALWSPTARHPDCPFVCIEPWYGRCDTAGYTGEFQNRPWMWHLQPGETFDASYRINILL